MRMCSGRIPSAVAASRPAFDLQPPVSCLYIFHLMNHVFARIEESRRTRRHRRWRSIDSPLKSAKNDSCRNGATPIPRDIARIVDSETIRQTCSVKIPIEDGQGDEACEPEEHGQGIQG